MTTAQPPAPPGPRQTPQARRSAPFPTSPRPPRAGDRPRRRRRPPPFRRRRRPPRTARAPPHRRHCSSLHCADRRRPTPIGRRGSASVGVDRRRPSPRTHPQDGARRPRTDGTAPSRWRGRVARDSRLLGRLAHAPACGGIEREFARGGAAATAAARRGAPRCATNESGRLTERLCVGEQRQLRECVWFSPHCTHARQETMFPDETW